MTEQKLTLLTIKEVAEILRVDPLTVNRWIQANKLKAFKIGKLWRIKEEDLKQLIEEGENNYEIKIGR